MVDGRNRERHAWNRAAASIWCVALLAVAHTNRTLAEDPRDIAFECPCAADWVAGEDGSGVLTLEFGIRSFRGTDSAPVTLRVTAVDDDRIGFHAVALGPVPANELLYPSTSTTRGSAQNPSSDTILSVALVEAAGFDVEPRDFRWHESLTLWPVPNHAEPGRIRYVDILTDSDGDGVGDVNERIAGTSPDDPDSVPGISIVDVLALVDRQNRQAYESEWWAPGSLAARAHHVTTLANSFHLDSGTNIRLRLVGVAEIELDEQGWASANTVEELSTLHGADVTYQFFYWHKYPCFFCAGVGGYKTLGRWHYAHAGGFATGGGVALAHELGHVMGLAHSAPQGETYGAFRWSRGHVVEGVAYVDGVGFHGGTIMAFPQGVYRRFSSPVADCGGIPCGVRRGDVFGADATASLDIVRFQVAAHRESKPDSDGDGVVDSADAFPDDPADWNDHDGDGVGDTADPDDDDDGVRDERDAFPNDPDEWEDLDGDRIGDNADEEVTDLGFFRDPALRAVVESALGKSTGEPISADEMATITILRGQRKDIRDLTGLEKATELRHLDLYDNRIADLTPLSGLTKLEGLDLTANVISDVTPLSRLNMLRSLGLRGNEVADLAPLSELTALWRLYLDGNQISDLTPLSGLTSLALLELSNNRISDLAPLAGLTGISWYLRLENNEISDLEPLSGMTALSFLYLGGNRISDLTPLSGLSSLQKLRLQSNEISDPLPLAGLTNLDELFLQDNAITDLTFLSNMTRLNGLWLGGNRVSDVSPLSALTALKTLDLDDNEISDTEPLADLTALTVLSLANTGVSEVASLAGLTALETLHLDDNRISDLEPLSGLTALEALHLDANEIADLAPLADLAAITTLSLRDNGVSDLEPLSELPQLRHLHLSRNKVRDIAALTELTALEEVDLDGNAIVDLPTMSGLTALHRLDVGGNRVAGVATLSGLTGLGDLSLHDNAVADIESLVDQDIWSDTGSRTLRLEGNPLIPAAFEHHIPTLKSWGIDVSYAAWLPDAALRALVAQQRTQHPGAYTDEPITGGAYLYALYAYNAGVSDLTGLEAIESLTVIYLGSNAVADLTPLADLNLWLLDLNDNQVSDLSPLVGIPSLALLYVRGNPLTEESLNTHIPALRVAGVRVEVDRLDWTVVADRGTATYDTSGYFASLLGTGAVVEAEANESGLAGVEMVGHILEVTPGSREGTLSLTLTATNDDGETASLRFDVIVALAKPVPFFPPASDTARQGFVRVVNGSDEAGTVRIEAMDRSGGRAMPITLSLDAGEAAHFNSDDLENGNRAKHLTGSTGAREGDSRLELASGLDIEVLSYVRTTDGFFTAMHDVVPEANDEHRVAIFSPAEDTGPSSRLRLINPGGEAANIEIEGVDDAGAASDNRVQVTVAARSERTLTAEELEIGGPDITGSLGDGTGNWQLTVSADQHVQAMSLLESAEESSEGHLSNLSTIPDPMDGAFVVPLFPATSDEWSRQGFVRVINRGDAAAQVLIAVSDETNREYEPLTLTVGANETVHFDSTDLELGNADNGLTGTGAGEGDWRLWLTSESDIEVLAYIQTAEGFLTSMHDTVSAVDNRHRVVTFGLGRNTSQVSRLRLINAGEESAELTITGIDDAGDRRPPIRATVAAGAVESFTAEELEWGTTDLQGALGRGRGMWQLIVESDRPIIVMNLLESPSGRLTNLSTLPPLVPPPAPPPVVNAITINDEEIYKDGQFANFGTAADPALPDEWVASGTDARFDGIRIYADGSVRPDIDPGSIVVDPSVRYAFTFEWESHVLDVVHAGDIVDVRFTPANAVAVSAFYDLLVNDTVGSVTLSDDPAINPTPNP